MSLQHSGLSRLILRDLGSGLTAPNQFFPLGDTGMLLGLCQELRELVDHDEEWLSDFSDEDVFEEGRPRQRQISQSYDPDSDDYQMVVTPELPEVIELEEKQLIMEQIMKLQHRIDLGGKPEIIEHYQKVKETWLEKLSMRATGDRFVSRFPKVDSLASCSMRSMSRLSTCDTDLASLGYPSSPESPSSAAFKGSFASSNEAEAGTGWHHIIGS
eukprot:s1191_g6.t1